MRLRDRARDFGRRREEPTIGGGACGEPALPIWFRPKSEKVRDWVWRKLGKREVDAQSPWLLLAATVFRSTNSGRGSGMRCFYSVGFAEEERNNDALVYVIYQICYMFVTASMQDQIMQNFWRDINRDQVKHVHFDKEMKMKFKSHVF